MATNAITVPRIAEMASTATTAAARVLARVRTARTSQRTQNTLARGPSTQTTAPGTASLTFIRRAASVLAAPTKCVSPASIARAHVDMAWVTSSTAQRAQRIVARANIGTAVATQAQASARVARKSLQTRYILDRVRSTRITVHGSANPCSTTKTASASAAPTRHAHFCDSAQAPATTALATVSHAKAARPTAASASIASRVVFSAQARVRRARIRIHLRATLVRAR